MRGMKLSHREFDFTLNSVVNDIFKNSRLVQEICLFKLFGCRFRKIPRWIF